MLLLPEQALAQILARAGEINMQQPEIAAIGMVVRVEGIVLDRGGEIRHRALAIAELEADAATVAVERRKVWREDQRLRVILLGLGRAAERELGMAARNMGHRLDLAIDPPLQDGVAGGEPLLGAVILAERDGPGFLGQNGLRAEQAEQRQRQDQDQERPPPEQAGHANLPDTIPHGN